MKTTYCFACGVFKLDYMSAGAPQLREIAQQRIQKDSYFTSLVVRKVSKENMGIHFTYVNATLEIEDHQEVRKLWFKKEPEEKFQDGIYIYMVSRLPTKKKNQNL